MIAITFFFSTISTNVRHKFLETSVRIEPGSLTASRPDKINEKQKKSCCIVYCWLRWAQQHTVKISLSSGHFSFSVSPDWPGGSGYVEQPAGHQPLRPIDRSSLDHHENSVRASCKFVWPLLLILLIHLQSKSLKGIANKKKQHLNRDSHIASSPILQSWFFEEVLDFGFHTEEASWVQRIF